MARTVNRGDIWTYRFQAPDKQRPVVVLTRQEVIPLLRTVMVAPITSTIRGAPGEVVVGVEHGLQHDSAVNLDHVQTVEQSRLVRRIGKLGPAEMREVCRALSVAAGCDGHRTVDAAVERVQAIARRRRKEPDSVVDAFIAERRGEAVIFEGGRARPRGGPS